MSEKKFIPIDFNVQIKIIEETNKFGIKDESMSWRSKVIAIGDMVSLVKVGDIIWTSKYVGLPYKDTRIIKEHEILGKEKENAKSESDNTSS